MSTLNTDTNLYELDDKVTLGLHLGAGASDSYLLEAANVLVTKDSTEMTVQEAIEALVNSDAALETMIEVVGTSSTVSGDDYITVSQDQNGCELSLSDLPFSKIAAPGPTDTSWFTSDFFTYRYTTATTLADFASDVLYSMEAIILGKKWTCTDGVATAGYESASFSLSTFYSDGSSSCEEFTLYPLASNTYLNSSSSDWAINGLSFFTIDYSSIGDGFYVTVSDYLTGFASAVDSAIRYITEKATLSFSNGTLTLSYPSYSASIVSGGMQAINYEGSTISVDLSDLVTSSDLEWTTI